MAKSFSERQFTMGGRAQCWGQLTHRGGGAAQLFHTLEDQETETYLVSGPHPEVESPSRPVPRNSCLRDYSLGFCLLTRASSRGPNAQIHRQGYFILNHSFQGCSGLLKAEHHCSRAFQVGTHFSAFEASAEPLVDQTFTSPGLFLSVLHSVFVPSSGFCLFVSCLFCGSFFVFITFW